MPEDFFLNIFFLSLLHVCDVLICALDLACGLTTGFFWQCWTVSVGHSSACWSKSTISCSLS